MSTDPGMPLVLLHGWGMGPGVFAAWRPWLGTNREVYCPAWADDVATSAADPLGAIGASVADGLDRPAHWIGWSLGGLIALAAARQRPGSVARVTLVAASPRMAAAPDWPGIDPRELQRFRRELQREPVATHDRFLALQVRGSHGSRTALRALRAAVASDGLPSMEVLLCGLDQLMESDLRSGLGALSCPVDAVLGECDALVPAAMAARLAALSVPARTIPGAGHAPFLSHPGIVTDTVLGTGVLS